MFIFKIIRIVLTLVFGGIYWLFNTLYLKVQKWYFGMKAKDIIIWYAFTPFYWIIVAIVMVVSIPYEAVAKNLH
jgi:hypothetical protein